MSYTAQTELSIKPCDSLTPDAISYLWFWFRRTGWIKHATAQYTLQEFISRVLCFWQLLFWLWNSHIIYNTVLDSIYLNKYVTYSQYFCPHPFHPTVTRFFSFFLLSFWHAETSNSLSCLEIGAKKTNFLLLKPKCSLICSYKKLLYSC